jgi:hypothetical protein
MNSGVDPNSPRLLAHTEPRQVQEIVFIGCTSGVSFSGNPSIALDSQGGHAMVRDPAGRSQ